MFVDLLLGKVIVPRATPCSKTVMSAKRGGEREGGREEMVVW